MIVYVEKKVLEDPAISGDENFGAITKKFCTFREGTKSNQSLCSGCLDTYILKKTVKIFGGIFKRFVAVVFLRS